MLDSQMAVELNSPGGGQALVQGIGKLVHSRYKLTKGLAHIWAEAIKESSKNVSDMLNSAFNMLESMSVRF